MLPKVRGAGFARGRFHSWRRLARKERGRGRVEPLWQVAMHEPP